MVKFGWLGTKRREAITAHVQEQAHAWWKEWGVSATPAVEMLDAVSTREGFNLHAGHLAIKVQGDFSGVLAGIRDLDGGAFAASLATAALVDLATRLLPPAVDTLPAAQPMDTLPASFHDPRLGTLGYGLTWEGAALQLCLDRHAIDQLQPPSAWTSKPLVARKDAIAHASIRLTACLDLDTIALGEMRQLQSGDVIATRVPLDRLFELCAAHGASIHQGRLGRQGSKRAMLVQATTAIENRTP